jgi:RNA polymerase sigma-70 factor (ECF subfamily)
MKYLYTIARNLCIDEYRRITPSRLPEEDAESMIPDGTNMEEHILLRDALERLTPKDREMLLLRYANDERIGTISALLNQSRFSTYRRLKSAEKHLRDAWEVSDK